MEPFSDSPSARPAVYKYPATLARCPLGSAAKVGPCVARVNAAPSDWPGTRSVHCGDLPIICANRSVKGLRISPPLACRWLRLHAALFIIWSE